jgi:hypothetical protein
MCLQKPVRLELSSGTRWLTLGRFDAADDDQSSLVLDAAEDLVRTLHNSEAAATCPRLRVAMDDGLGQELLSWDLEAGWRDVVTGEPA